MQRMTISVAALVFAGLAGAPAAAQDVPEEARKAIAENLQGSFLVYRDKVQDDLKLTNEQKEKLAGHLKERLPDFMKFFEGLGEKKADEREKELKAFRQTAQEKLAPVLKDTLKADQAKRLRQLELQQEGPFALLHTEQSALAVEGRGFRHRLGDAQAHEEPDEIAHHEAVVLGAVRRKVRFGNQVYGNRYFFAGPVFHPA